MIKDIASPARDFPHSRSNPAVPTAKNHGTTPDEPIELDPEDIPARDPNSIEADIMPLPTVDHQPTTSAKSPRTPLNLHCGLSQWEIPDNPVSHKHGLPKWDVLNNHHSRDRSCPKRRRSGKEMEADILAEADLLLTVEQWQSRHGLSDARIWVTLTSLLGLFARRSMDEGREGE
ncbi:hypothetical protein K490DRAFT_62723 [Saccharata proteae CBS 121410]|uniref:Uncharacterized protein n=1 Tax=Saccharata proteae CBS 121410 TaxID=1314787 RepID=A0A9P4LWR3_9PEZI|nr:hypothetical protein K490DRAFT_62723 [Saccharata proteae CBS 121410]